MNHFQRSLDDYITGKNDPDAPFNQIDKVFECANCGIDVELSVSKNFDPQDQEDPIWCETCEKLHKEQIKNDAIYHEKKEGL